MCAVRRTDLKALAIRHWPLLAVLAIGAALRIAVAIAYHPGLFFSDSWSYTRLAYSPGFAPDRPSGYPLAIALLSLPGRSLSVITAVQHLAGLATGALVFAVLVRLRVSRYVAAAGAALVLVDLYAISLEQFVMAEAFFTFALMASFLLAVRRESGATVIAVSGVLLAGAATMRSIALFAVPVWLLYLVWTRHGARRVLLAGAAGVALPLVLYASVHAAAGKGFGFTQVGGWALYSRVAAFADCDKSPVPADTRGLCQSASERGGPPSQYGWSAESPANRLYGGRRIYGNGRLRAFGSAVLRHQTGDYVNAVVGDFLRFFRPGVEPPQASGGYKEPILLPAPGDVVFRSPFADSVRAQYFPGYERRIRAPASALRDAQKYLHSSKPIAALMLLLALVSLAISLRRLQPHRAETFLFAGAALAMLALAASLEYQVRYLVPVMPLLVCGGLVAARDLASLRSQPISR